MAARAFNVNVIVEVKRFILNIKHDVGPLIFTFIVYSQAPDFNTGCNGISGFRIKVDVLMFILPTEPAM